MREIKEILKLWRESHKPSKIGNMAEAINKIDSILKELNGADEEGISKKLPWVLFNENYTLSQASITEYNKINPLPSGIALKIFFNNETAEIKIYALKFLDVNEGRLLP